MRNNKHLTLHKRVMWLLLAIVFITFLTACNRLSAPVNTASESKPPESPQSTQAIETAAIEPEPELKTGTYIYDGGIYTKQFSLNSAYFGTDELYVIDCDNLLFVVLNIKDGRVKQSAALPEKQSISPEDWENKFDKSMPLDYVKIDKYKNCYEYIINNKYNLYLMDGELWLGILDLESAKADNFETVIKLRLEDESTENVNALKAGYRLLCSVTSSLKGSKGRYCQDVETKVDNYTQNFDGRHISASFTLTLSWNYIGYDNPNSFNYGKKKQQSIYDIKAEADIKGGYLDHQSMIILAAVSGAEWTDISYREDMDFYLAADVEGALDETLARKLNYQIADFSNGEIYIGPDEDVGDTGTDIETFNLAYNIEWQVLQAYSEIEIPEGHYICFTIENGDTLIFYEGSDIASYTSGGITEYYHTGVELYKRLLNWALLTKDRIFISAELTEKIAAGKADADTLIAYVWSEIEEAATASAKNSLQVNDGTGTYFIDAEITRLELAESYENLVDGAVVELWALDYALEAEDISKIMLAGGMSLDEKGRLKNTGSMGSRCPVVINSGGEREAIGAVYYLGHRGYALGGIRELLDQQGITDGWFKRLYDSLTYTLTYIENGAAEETVTLTDEDVNNLWDIINSYGLTLYEGMITEDRKESVLLLGDSSRGIEFIAGTEVVVTHENGISTMYGSYSKDRRDRTDMPQAAIEFYNHRTGN